MKLHWGFVSTDFAFPSSIINEINETNNVTKITANTKKVQIGNDQGMAQSERNSHVLNRGVGKNLNDT